MKNINLLKKSYINLAVIAIVFAIGVPVAVFLARSPEPQPFAQQAPQCMGSCLQNACANPASYCSSNNTCPAQNCMSPCDTSTHDYNSSLTCPGNQVCCTPKKSTTPNGYPACPVAILGCDPHIKDSSFVCSGSRPY